MQGPSWQSAFNKFSDLLAVGANHATSDIANRSEAPKMTGKRRTAGARVARGRAAFAALPRFSSAMSIGDRAGLLTCRVLFLDS
jgi:hypothetical protein